MPHKGSPYVDRLEQPACKKSICSVCYKYRRLVECSADDVTVSVNMMLAYHQRTDENVVTVVVVAVAVAVAMLVCHIGSKSK